MKTLMASLILLIAATSAWSNTTPSPSSGELVPEYTHIKMPNGLVLLLLEHHELPLVNFELTLRTGSIADPKDKEGLADVTMSLLRKGTAKYSAEKLAEELDFLGAELGLNAGLESCSMEAQFLAKNVDAGLDLLLQVLLEPTFPEDELRKTLDLRVDSIREAKDNPRRVIRAYYEGFLFQGHAFGRPVGGTETSLPQITRQDVVGFHETNVRPNNAILAVVGDFKVSEMRHRLEEALGDWEQKSHPSPAAVAPTAVGGRKVLLVDKPDAVQTYFLIGNVGVQKGNPHTAPLHVVNTVFGGRFTSWLQNEMRTKAGLTYNAHSRFIERTVPGPFYISSFTRTADTEKAMDMALDILERLHKNGLTQTELESARNYIRGQFPPRYETAGELASAMTQLEFYGLERDYINAHTQQTDTVSLADIEEIIRTCYPKENLAIVMIGQANEIQKVAEKYGKVHTKNISEPGY